MVGKAAGQVVASETVSDPPSRYVPPRRVALRVSVEKRNTMRSRPSLLSHAGLGALLSLVTLTTGCAANYLRSAPADRAGLSQPAQSVSRNVVLVSIDGLRPDAIARFDATNLQRLIREGSFTLHATTITPSKTLPSHTSMLTGEGPDRHQVLWNNVAGAKRDTIDLPNIFSVARASGYETAAFFSKAKFEPLQRSGTLDYSQAPGGLWGRWSGSRTVDDVARHLATAKPNVLFVHLSDPDAAGHRSGWMSADYGRGVLKADAAVGRLIALADEAYGAGNYALIVTADHGGHDDNHGSEDPRDVTIPWIAWGKGVRPGALATPVVRTMDTASTVLWLLGLTEPTDWAGTPVIDAFAPVAAPAPTSGSR
jgi:arylsulfatase A-like enzyme